MKPAPANPHQPTKPRKRSRWADSDSDNDQADHLHTKTKAKAKVKTPAAPAAAAAPAPASSLKRAKLQDSTPPPPPPRSPSPPPLPAPLIHSHYPPATDSRLPPCRSVDCYEKLNRIDEGAYGIVYRARCKSSSQIVALKRLKLDATTDRSGFPITALREMSALLRMRAHPHIVHVREVVVGASLSSVFMVMEFVDHDLKTLLGAMKDGTNGGFRPSEVKTLMRQLLSAVDFLHARCRMVHRDLKTSNLLMTNDGVLKVADFGLIRKLTCSQDDPADNKCTTYSSKLTPLVVTLWYRPPDLLLGAQSYDAKLDMWSIGCIFAELVTCDALFPGQGELDQIDRILKVLGTPPAALRALPNAKALNLTRHGNGCGLREKVPGMSVQAYALLGRLLAYEPENRVSARDALDHAYFRSHPPPKDPSMFPSFPSKASGEVKKRDSPSAPMAHHGHNNGGASGNNSTGSSSSASAVTSMLFGHASAGSASGGMDMSKAAALERQVESAFRLRY
ncbi:kinase-like domain-containing protein [Catenaria anguillulae PL171]|uniref:Kinase-like domain-containing protein n=1 Tax=Catenaria anguillulae PL171 TaxID=765915 RepID=A0A1Y2HRK4_9FUNG|nr:kinase-like domain-containing protein [Catenaria anguillulae PL171]